MGEQHIQKAMKSVETSTSSMTKTSHIKMMWSRLMNEYFLFQYGEEFCRIVSKCVFQRVEYLLWNVHHDEDAYPRYYDYDGTFQIGTEIFSYTSHENESK